MSKIIYITIDGVRYKAKVAHYNGTTHCIVLGPGPLAGKTIALNTHHAQATAQSSGPKIIDGMYALVAPITGRVMQVNATAGQKIESGSCALVVEAMKMENELNVEVSGTVSQVLVQEGDMVTTGQFLVKIKTAIISCQ